MVDGQPCHRDKDHVGRREDTKVGQSHAPEWFGVPFGPIPRGGGDDKVMEKIF